MSVCVCLCVCVCVCVREREREREIENKQTQKNLGDNLILKTLLNHNPGGHHSLQDRYHVTMGQK
jgi:hypothetical protein